MVSTVVFTLTGVCALSRCSRNFYSDRTVLLAMVMGSLEFRFLGDLQVLRDGQPVDLPPSKKTRALLAYLALNPETHRRDRLCELLWEIPDDPRGSLRWSLSKLRRVVNDDAVQRIVADRTYVSLKPEELEIDAVAAQRLAESVEQTPTDELVAAAERWRGNLLEGLDLSNFHDFHSWCVAERERSCQAQITLLRALLGRQDLDDGGRLSYARALVTLVPYEETARAGLVSLLMERGHFDEADQQFELGMKMLAEVGAPPSGLLVQARNTGLKPAAPAPAVPFAPGPRSATSTDLVGREAELAELETHLMTLRNGGGAAVVLLEGEPGIGKSSLLNHARAAAPDCRLLESSAFESEMMRPYALWLDAFRRVDDQALPEVFNATTEHHNRELLFGGLSDFVLAVSEQQPVVMLFDDLQWCDESSAAALHYVVRINQHRPLLVLLAARTGELHDNTPVQQALRGLRREGLLSELQVGPLDPEATAQIVARHVGEGDTAPLARACGGNPLLAVELARAEAAGGAGTSLAELVRDRLAPFELQDAELVRWASLQSGRLDVDLLALAAEVDRARVDAVLDSAIRQSLMTLSEGGVRFAHDLIRSSIYADLSPGRRQAMHRQLARLLEERAEVDLEFAANLAHHATQGGDPGLACRAMISAGRLCQRFFANDDAAVLARRGLQFADQLGAAERIRHSLELHQVLYSTAPVEDWQAAAELYGSLAEQALELGDTEGASLGYVMASNIRWAHGQWAGAREETLQVERVTRGGSVQEHVFGMAETARCLAMLERDMGEAASLLTEATAVARAESVSHPVLSLASGLLDFHQGRMDEAESHFLAARVQYKSEGARVDEYQANEYLLLIGLARADQSGVARRVEALLELGGKLREGSEAPFARAMQAYVDYSAGGDGLDLDDAIDALRAADAKHRLATVLIRAAMVDVARDCLDTALLRAGEAAQHARSLERASELALAEAVVATVHARRGEQTDLALALERIAEIDMSGAAIWAQRHCEHWVGQLKPEGL